ncbi:interferon-induced protein 44-like isoform X2 [Mercenaria mercenaria]|uniref:interferon-induced protein 44-like isoform X2 n=1 Tax=Mercenaria mercenaria TaxID=6596 RepID=UPI00234EDD72|nr:interferon-induced protein 44-like isoform X2 [Mercenaria mercenaria]
MGNENTKAKESGKKQGNDAAATAAQVDPAAFRPFTVFHRAMHSAGNSRNNQDGDTSHDFTSHMSKQRPALQASGEEQGDEIEKPWRSLDKNGAWDENYKKRLINEIGNTHIKEKEVQNVRILLLGPIKAGKSSYLNTIASIDKGRMSQVTITGGAGISLSRKLKVFRPQERLKNFRLLDTMGIEDTDLGGFNIRDLLFVVKGHVPPDYKFNPVNPIFEDSKDFKKNPKSKDKIHCVVFVMDANVVGQDNISDATKKKVKALQAELMNIDIPRIVILTKIDVLCGMTEADTVNCFRSETVKNAVDLAEELFSVPKQNIFPVQNYSEEMEMDTNKDILSLLALKQMILFGADFLNDISAQTSDDEEAS